MDLFSDLTLRGLIHQCTAPETVPAWLASGSRTLYCGFDPTADSLHVGSLLPVMIAAAVSEGGTPADCAGRRGDGHDRRPERQERRAEPALSRAACRRTSPGSRSSCAACSISTARKRRCLLNNFDWMRGFSYLDFLRDVGKHFPVNVMLAKDSVKGRLERDDAASATPSSATCCCRRTTSST